ncbi:TetR/AcrR family transcriptional regulator [Saccharopolyspora rosea]|uniref:TetR/AcrR family transcriptional regulator n=1 Tax=Saccharopolyspora rosea TaxID=524884 RepID=A0ABW3G1U2_9PSEU|nr:TetR/AcrR family transcriptional regulator [Saccharopolyspora rosea]
MERQRKPVTTRRDEIIAATLDLIAERGIGSVRAADIAGRLGISTALVFYHFATLENLVVEAFAAAAERDLRRLDAVLRDTDGSAETRLRAVLREYGPTGDAAGWVLWIEAWAAGLRHPRLREVAQRLDLRWREVVAELLADGVRSGEFGCADPRSASWRVTAMLDGLAVQLVAREGVVSRADVDGWLDHVLSAELGV